MRVLQFGVGIGEHERERATHLALIEVIFQGAYAGRCERAIEETCELGIVGASVVGTTRRIARERCGQRAQDTGPSSVKVGFACMPRGCEAGAPCSEVSAGFYAAPFKSLKRLTSRLLSISRIALSRLEPSSCRASRSRARVPRSSAWRISETQRDAVTRWML